MGLIESLRLELELSLCLFVLGRCGGVFKLSTFFSKFLIRVSMDSMVLRVEMLLTLFVLTDWMSGTDVESVSSFSSRSVSRRLLRT